ncbi:MAG: hypothetical protein ACXIUW_16435 [Roseinatronobacter sp.]
MHNGSFLLLEGDSDASLLKKFIDQSECALIVCSGKENALEAITILTQSHFEGVLAILDKDFSDIIGFPEFEGVVLFTEHNDAEIMIMSSAALDDVLLEFGIDDRKKALEKAAGQPICDIIFEASAFLGTLRLLSLREGWNLRFEGMTYKFLDANSYELDELRTVNHITGRSDRRPALSVDEVVQMVAVEMEPRCKKDEICCGHDCVRLLGRALHRRIGNTNQFNNDDGAKNLEKILRIAYNMDHFRHTKLYHDICEWEACSGYSVLRA